MLQQSALFAVEKASLSSVWLSRLRSAQCEQSTHPGNGISKSRPRVRHVHSLVACCEGWRLGIAPCAGISPRAPQASISWYNLRVRLVVRKGRGLSLCVHSKTCPCDYAHMTHDPLPSPPPNPTRVVVLVLSLSAPAVVPVCWVPPIEKSHK